MEQLTELKEFNIEKALERLRKYRKIFHCEADFQFALARGIDTMYKDLNIRLEYFYKEDEDKNRQYIDILVLDKEKKNCIPIELKYKTNKEEEIELENEVYHLKKQSAKNDNSFYVVKDLERIEKLVYEEDNKTYNLDNLNVIKGYVIFLTTYECYKTNKLTGEAKEFNLACEKGKNEIEVKAVNKKYKGKYDIDLKRNHKGIWSDLNKFKDDNEQIHQLFQLVFEVEKKGDDLLCL